MLTTAPAAPHRHTAAGETVTENSEVPVGGTSSNTRGRAHTSHMAINSDPRDGLDAARRARATRCSSWQPSHAAVEVDSWAAMAFRFAAKMVSPSANGVATARTRKTVTHNPARLRRTFSGPAEPLPELG